MATPTKPMQTVDLPINEVTGYLEGLLNQLGDECTIDGVQTKIMISDLIRIYDYIQENQKQAVVSKTITIKRGSKVLFHDGRKAMAYTIPNDDIVSYSTKLLMFNASLVIKNNEPTYNDDGDIISLDDSDRAVIDGFIERVTYNDKQFDVGVLPQIILRFTTYPDSQIKLNDNVMYKGKKYKVLDVNDVTEGLLVIELGDVKR
jgi:hypothetical protein